MMSFWVMLVIWLQKGVGADASGSLVGSAGLAGGTGDRTLANLFLCEGSRKPASQGPQWTGLRPGLHLRSPKDRAGIWTSPRVFDGQGWDLGLT